MRMSFQKLSIPNKYVLCDPYIIAAALVEDKDSPSSPRKLSD